MMADDQPRNKLVEDSHNTYYHSGNKSAINRGRGGKFKHGDTLNQDSNINSSSESRYYTDVSQTRVTENLPGQTLETKTENVRSNATAAYDVATVLLRDVSDISRAKQEILHKLKLGNIQQVQVGVEETTEENTSKVLRDIRMAIDMCVTQELITEDRARDVVYGIYRPEQSEKDMTPTEEHEDIARQAFLGDESEAKDAVTVPTEESGEEADTESSVQEATETEEGDAGGAAGDAENQEVAAPEEEYDSDDLDDVDQPPPAESEEKKSAEDWNKEILDKLSNEDDPAVREVQKSLNAYTRKQIRDIAVEAKKESSESSAEESDDIKSLTAKGFTE